MTGFNRRGGGAKISCGYWSSVGSGGALCCVCLLVETVQDSTDNAGFADEGEDLLLGPASDDGQTVENCALLESYARISSTTRAGSTPVTLA